MESILFYCFAALTVGLALVVIVQPNPVGAAVALVGAFFGVAGIFVLLQAHFVAIMQLLLYAGAIMVFFVFVVMLLNLEPRSIRFRTLTGSRLVRSTAAIYLAAILLLSMLGALRMNKMPAVAATDGTLEAVGRLLLTDYVVPFEILSVLLLVAIVGAVAMGKREL